jgi:Ca-activated chloride channel family protein
MNNEHILDRIHEYIDGELAPEEESMVRKHIASCTDCAKEVAEIEKLLGQFRALPNEAKLPDGFLDEADAALRESMLHSRRNGTVAEPKAANVIPLFSRIRWYYAAAAMLLVAGISVFVVMKMNRQPSPVSVAAVTPQVEQQQMHQQGDTASHAETSNAVPQVETEAGNRTESQQQHPEIAMNDRGNHLTKAYETAPSLAAAVTADTAMNTQTGASQTSITAAQEIPKTAKITGRVVDEKGDPLPGVVVKVLGTTRGAVSDPDGNYTIAGLPVGTYCIRVSYVGYEQQQADSIKVNGESVLENFRLSASNVALNEVVITGPRLNVNSSSTPSAKIAGRVVDEKGDPLPGAVVKVLGTNRGAVTDPDGRYTIIGVPIGTYSIEADLVGYISQRIDNVKFEADQVFFRDFRLAMTTVQQAEVAITAQKEMVSPPSKSSDKTVDRKQIEAVPSQVNVENDVKIQNENPPTFVPDVARRAGSEKQGVQFHKGSGTSNVKADGGAESMYGFLYRHHRPPTDRLRYYYPPVNENSEEYKKYAENGFMDVAGNPLSTFAIDVDAASYTNVRRFLNNGQRPPIDAVKIEEMINYFKYDYPQPRAGQPFSITTEMAARCPWNCDHMLLLVGLQGKNIDARELPPSNLVFLIDVSGSMRDANKLPLVKEAFKMLVQQLRRQDRVSIVTYAGNAGLRLPSTPGNEKGMILDAIDGLQAMGSTAGGEGIQLAYQIAKENFTDDGNNRVILATDGDFNVGVSSEDDLVRLIEEHRNENIFLTVLGFGMGNYKNNKMQLLADKGNGNNYYIDNLQEAQRVFVGQMSGTLFTIAKDVKIQIEFNPEHVAAYRLIGYEKRLLNKEDFNDDTKDGGELGAGHTVTALYELVPPGASTGYPSVDPLKYQKVTPPPAGHKYSDELLTVKLRYKEPTGDESKLITQVLKRNEIRELSRAGENLRFAAGVAEFGMLLGNSKFKAASSFDNVRELAESARDNDREGYRSEFIRLVEIARNLYIGGHDWR